MENKKQVIEDFLSQGKSVLCIDPTVKGVKLPKHLMDADTVKLNLSNTSAYPMQFKEDKVVTTLTFGGVPFECHIPYMSIFAVMIAGTSPDEAVVFDDSVPPAMEKISHSENNNHDAMKFMAELEKQFDRDDITVGKYNDKPQ